jgi:hypothetical protein
MKENTFMFRYLCLKKKKNKNDRIENSECFGI